MEEDSKSIRMHSTTCHVLVPFKLDQESLLIGQVSNSYPKGIKQPSEILISANGKQTIILLLQWLVSNLSTIAQYLGLFLIRYAPFSLAEGMKSNRLRYRLKRAIDYKRIHKISTYFIKAWQNPFSDKNSSTVFLCMWGKFNQTKSIFTKSYTDCRISF